MNSIRQTMSKMNNVEFNEGLIEGVVIQEIALHDDQRGWRAELFRADELAGDQLPQMAYVSETLPGVVRGPHEHVEQTDLFAFLGPGNFRLYLRDARLNSATHGNRQTLDVGELNRVSVIVPPGVVHAYKNTGQRPALVFNAPNRLYAGEGKRHQVDEIRHEYDEASPYKID